MLHTQRPGKDIKTDKEIIEKALAVLDAFHASLLDMHKQ
jgi:hypothetical protein